MRRLAGFVGAAAEMFVLLAGCGGGGPGTVGTGAAGTTGETGGQNEDPGTNNPGTGGDPTDPGTNPGTGGEPNQDPDGSIVDPQELGSVSPAPEFEGIDIEQLTLGATPGCSGGYDAATKTLTLSIDPALHSVLIDATDGKIRANSIDCTAADGATVASAEVSRLVVQGTGEDDMVVLDLLVGDLGSALLGKADAIQVDLGEGNDRLAIRATRGDDVLRCVGVDGGGASVDLGAGVQSLRVKGLESIVASLGPGNDRFLGSAGTACPIPVVVYGGAGSDSLQGGAKNDVLNGGEGPDEFDMGSSLGGADIVNGGPDGDVVSYERRSKAVTIKLCSSSSYSGCVAPDCTCAGENGEASERDVIVNVEDAIGGEGNDTIVGNAESNALSGNAGNDHIDGQSGDDQLYGDSGDDVLAGGDDDDIIVGGPGKDEIDGQKGDNVCLYDAKDLPLKGCGTPVLTSGG